MSRSAYKANPTSLLWWMKSPDMAKENMENEVLNHQKGCSLRVQTNFCNCGQPPGRMKDGAGEVASRFC